MVPTPLILLSRLAKLFGKWLWIWLFMSASESRKLVFQCFDDDINAFPVLWMSRVQTVFSRQTSIVINCRLRTTICGENPDIQYPAVL